MRNQYKVLSERYEQVQENEDYSDSPVYKYILNQIINYSQPENKDTFVEIVKAYHLVIFKQAPGHSRGTQIEPGFAELIQKTFSSGQSFESEPLRPASAWEPSRNPTLSERLYLAIHWAAYLIKPNHGTKRIRQHAVACFYAWCKALKEYRAIQAAQTQHTKTHGVDLGDL